MNAIGIENRGLGLGLDSPWGILGQSGSGLELGLGEGRG